MVTRRTASRAEALPIDSSLFFKLARVVNLTARPFLETLSRTHHLSLNEWRVMVVLASHPGCAAHEVAEACGLDKMSVSRALAGLARRARIVKRADPTDARRTLLQLSSAGQRLFESIAPAAIQREAQLFGGLSDGDRTRLAALMDRLVAALREPAG